MTFMVALIQFKNSLSRHLINRRAAALQAADDITILTDDNVARQRRAEPGVQRCLAFQVCRTIENRCPDRNGWE